MAKFVVPPAFASTGAGPPKGLLVGTAYDCLDALMKSEAVDVLILGGGGREHALALACARENAGRVAVAPGNAGMAATGVNTLAVNPLDPVAVVALARQWQPQVVVIGPEAPLAAGVSDALRAAGVAVYGPSCELAQLETSKAYAKRFMERHGIPTARAVEVSALADLPAALARFPGRVVVKASGLAAGKGVVMASTRAEAEAAASAMLSGQAFGEAGQTIVLEEWLEGEEVSLLVVVGGGQYRCLLPAQDHKRIGEGDTGPNTGGMGAYAPARIYRPAVAEEVERTVVQRTLAGLAAEGYGPGTGRDFRGTLFIGLMLTPDGPRVLEYNCRFGDPETQAVLALLETPLAPLLLAAAEGVPERWPATLRWQAGAAATVVLAAAGYPETVVKGPAVGRPAAPVAGVTAHFAGVRAGATAGELVVDGGRVLGLTSTGATVAEAVQRALAAAPAYVWPGCQMRRDIGWRELARG